MNSAFALAFTNASLGRISLKLLSEMSGGIIQCSGDWWSQIMVIQTKWLQEVIRVCTLLSRNLIFGLHFQMIWFSLKMVHAIRVAPHMHNTRCLTDLSSVRASCVCVECRVSEVRWSSFEGSGRAMLRADKTAAATLNPFAMLSNSWGGGCKG